MQIFFDGIVIAGRYWEEILLFMVPVLGFGGLITSILSREKRIDWLLFPMSLPLGTIILALLSFALFSLARVWPNILHLGSWILFVLGLGALFLHGRHGQDWRSHILYIMGFSVLLIIRLAFLKDMQLPPYSDSPEHYLIVQHFLSPTLEGNSFYAIAGPYYHFGFHSLATWLTVIRGFDSPLLLALLGQIFLVVLPFSVFALVGGITQNNTSAWIALLLSGFGWQMPAFAANWGKYPAIVGMAVFPGVLVAIYLFWQNKNLKNTTLIVGLFFVVGAVFLHSRILVSFVLAFLSFYLALQFTDFLMTKGKTIKIVLWAISILLAFWMHWTTFFQVYYSNYFVVLIIIAIFIPFAFRSFPILSLAAFLYLFGIGFASKITLPPFLQGYSYRLLDRTFLQIALFLPLSMLGALGLSGFIKAFTGQSHVKRGAITVIFLIFAWNATQLSYYPDPCCGYVRNRDLAAYDWIKLNLPSDATLIIPGLRVSDRLIGTDAGIWIQPLTGRETKKRPFDISLFAPDVVNDFCLFNSPYIYVGGRQFSFNSSEPELSNRYKELFSQGKTSIYQIDCASH
ncbi:MAG: hypothetical protein ISR59_00835 [Anaerolineales bacterium]|uniref:Uncharacterized protein n=1 Tax=Candidatus Desulfolinea nitratireducens TaxID=2841698 RepID=A0A8J6TJD4_9CHLR|nr:hypothetical protein [Candidatus Desulfolinea nitratireducens]MBL6959622.1 hypothetical protein [Anaerolineales bacterium]